MKPEIDTVALGEKNIGNIDSDKFINDFFNVTPAQKAMNNYLVKKEIKAFKSYLGQDAVYGKNVVELSRSSKLGFMFEIGKIVTFILLAFLGYNMNFVWHLGFAWFLAFIGLVLVVGKSWFMIIDHFLMTKNNFFTRNGLNLKITSPKDKEDFLSTLQIFLTSDYLNDVPNKDEIVKNALLLVAGNVSASSVFGIYHALLDAALEAEDKYPSLGISSDFKPSLNKDLPKDLFYK